MLKLIPASQTDIPMIRSLYTRAFPANERRPLGPLLDDTTGHSQVLSAYCEDGFCGFVCILEWADIVHIIYFAVEENLRGRGLGSEILRAVHQAGPQKRVIVDIEEPDSSAPNHEQRIKRKAFYLHNGYRETDIRYRWLGTDYVILSHGGNMTEEEFGRFWDALAAAMPGSEDY